MDKIVWYERRVKALEGLLACYRAGRQPSERLFRELELTGQHIDHDGQWITASSVVALTQPAEEINNG